MEIICGLGGLVALALALSLFYVVSLPMYWIFNGKWPWNESRYLYRETHFVIVLFGLLGYTIVIGLLIMAVAIGCAILKK